MLPHSKSPSRSPDMMESDGHSLRRCHFHPRPKRYKVESSTEKREVTRSDNKPAMDILKSYWMIEVDVVGNGNGND